MAEVSKQVIIFFNTSGEGGKTGNQGRESDGGNGSSGGQGSINGYGGGGGGGYILEGPELFMRYTYFGDQDGVIPGSRVGINDGDPFVQISKVDVPTEYLTEFIMSILKILVLDCRRY